MSVLKPRNRLVYFRVTEDEFRELNCLCQSTGAHSISDLARSAIRSMMQNDRYGGGDGVHARLSVLETAVASLKQNLAQLTLSKVGDDPEAGAPGEVVEESANTSTQLQGA